MFSFGSGWSIPANESGHRPSYATGYCYDESSGFSPFPSTHTNTNTSTTKTRSHRFSLPKPLDWTLGPPTVLSRLSNKANEANEAKRSLERLLSQFGPPPTPTPSLDSRRVSVGSLGDTGLGLGVGLQGVKPRETSVDVDMGMVTDTDANADTDMHCTPLSTPLLLESESQSGDGDAMGSSGPEVRMMDVSPQRPSQPPNQPRPRETARTVVPTSASDVPTPTRSSSSSNPRSHSYCSVVAAPFAPRPLLISTSPSRPVGQTIYIPPEAPRLIGSHSHSHSYYRAHTLSQAPPHSPTHLHSSSNTTRTPPRSSHFYSDQRSTWHPYYRPQTHYRPQTLSLDEARALLEAHSRSVKSKLGHKRTWTPVQIQVQERERTQPETQTETETTGMAEKSPTRPLIRVESKSTSVFLSTLVSEPASAPASAPAKSASTSRQSSFVPRWTVLGEEEDDDDESEEEEIDELLPY